MFSKKLFGQRILALRKKHDETQTVLGELLGVGKNQISMIECGNATTSAERIALICEHYKISADYLLGLTDDPTPAFARLSTDAPPQSPPDGGDSSPARGEP